LGQLACRSLALALAAIYNAAGRAAAPAVLNIFFSPPSRKRMAGLDHGAAPPPERDDPIASARRARLGLILFFPYLAIYAGCVCLNAFDPAAAEQTPFAGVNLAILYGLALIAAALLLALLYDWLCRGHKREDRR
jgi:uncharacterized membrane protein (DUF485 family)